MNKKTIYISIVVLVAIIAIYSTNKANNSSLNVSAVQINSQIISKSVTASGIVKSDKNASLSFASTGNIYSINVEKGNKVINGQILARLDSSPQLESIQVSKDSRDIAIRNKEAYIDLNKNSSSDFLRGDEYKIQIRKYDELISQAEAGYNSQSGLIRNYYIKAPFSGTILDVYKEVGEVAGAGTTIIEVADLSDIYFEVKLDQEDFGSVKLNQKVEITLDSYPDMIFTGIVTELPLSSSIDSSGNQEFKLKIEIDDNKEYPILIGMSGDADIITEQSSDNVFAIPFDAVYTDFDDNTFLWIISSNGTLEKYFVETGIEGDLYTEIKDFKEEMKIVIPMDSKTTLLEGAKANVK